MLEPLRDYSVPFIGIPIVSESGSSRGDWYVRFRHIGEGLVSNDPFIAEVQEKDFERVEFKPMADPVSSDHPRHSLARKRIGGFAEAGIF